MGNKILPQLSHIIIKIAVMIQNNLNVKSEEYHSVSIPVTFLSEAESRMVVVESRMGRYWSKGIKIQFCKNKS